MDLQRLRKFSVNLLKIGISILLLVLVFRKIPFREVAGLWATISPLWLVPGAVLFLASQVVSARRLGLYLHAGGFPLAYRSNLELYFLGMFYNFFIPGGIGGDAYKIYLLNRKFGWSARPLTSALFNDRLSGLMAICLLIALLGAVSLPEWRWWFAAAFAGGIVAASVLSVKIFPRFRTVFWKALLASFGIQLLQVLSFICLLKSLGVGAGFLVYAMVFLASSVLSLISFSGIGVREMLFLQAAKQFDFLPQYSVSASMLFSIITAVFSLAGLYFQLRKLNLKLDNTYDFHQK